MNTEATLTYDARGISLTTDKTTSTVGSIGDLYSYYHHVQPNDLLYQPPSYTVTTASTIYRESKIDTAFKVVEKLMEKGHIKELSVKEFMALVKEIAATL